MRAGDRMCVLVGEESVLQVGLCGGWVGGVFGPARAHLGDHDVHPLVDALHGDVKVGVIRSEDNGDIALLEGGARLNVSLWVDGVVLGPRLALGGKALVHVPYLPLHVRAYAGELLAVYATHSDAGDLAAGAEVEHGEGDDAGRLVTVGGW